MPIQALEPVSQLALAILLSGAVWKDLVSRRIPNALVLWGLITGLALSVTPHGIGLSSAILGGMSGFLIFWILYVMNSVGAGDVKLVAATGVFMGFPAVLHLSLSIFMVGGVLAVVWALWTSQLSLVFKNIRTGLALLWAFRQLPMDRQLEIFPVSRTRLPYALAVGLGTVWHFLNPWVF
jgi:prepilin peptidase CpaA